MRSARAAVLATVLLAAGCGTDTPAVPATTTTAASAGSCSTVVRDRATITDDLIDKGCTDENGSKRLGKVRLCGNGQRLWEMDGFLGLSGKPMVPENEKGPDGITARILGELACR